MARLLLLVLVVATLGPPCLLATYPVLWRHPFARFTENHEGLAKVVRGAMWTLLIGGLLIGIDLPWRIAVCCLLVGLILPNLWAAAGVFRRWWTCVAFTVVPSASVLLGALLPMSVWASSMQTSALVVMVLSPLAVMGAQRCSNRPPALRGVYSAVLLFVGWYGIDTLLTGLSSPSLDTLVTYGQLAPGVATSYVTVPIMYQGQMVGLLGVSLEDLVIPGALLLSMALAAARYKLPSLIIVPAIAYLLALMASWSLLPYGWSAVPFMVAFMMLAFGLTARRNRKFKQVFRRRYDLDPGYRAFSDRLDNAE